MYPSQSTQWTKQRGKRAIAPPTASEVAAVLRWIPTAPDYDTWVRIVSAVGNTLPEAEAEAVLLAWSPDQKPGETLRKLRSRMTRVGYGSLIYQARQNGYAPKPSNRRKGAFRRHYAPPWPRGIPPHTAALNPLKIDLRPPSISELSAVAHLRGWPVFAGLQIAAERGLFAMSGGSTPAWTLTDSSRYAAQSRRLDGRLWSGVVAKAKTLRGSCASWPVGAAAIGNHRVVLLCEGGPDMLAALTVAWLLGVASAVAPVAMLGAGQSIAPAALVHFRNRHVRIVEQNDDAARKAGRRWAEQLRPVAATITGWEPPPEDKDLADTLTRLAAKVDDLERLADDLRASEILNGLGLQTKGDEK
jgi:hypothetical protein